MTLMERIRADQLQARKKHDDVAAGLLTALIGESVMVGKNAGNRESTEEEVTATVQKFLKNARETQRILSEQNQPRQPTAEYTPLDKLNREIMLLEDYLPQQMTAVELREIVVAIRTENPSANMGVIMKHLKDNFAGRYDGKVASQVVKDVLV